MGNLAKLHGFKTNRSSNEKSNVIPKLTTPKLLDTS